MADEILGYLSELHNHQYVVEMIRNGKFKIFFATDDEKRKTLPLSQVKMNDDWVDDYSSITIKLNRPQYSLKSENRFPYETKLYETATLISIFSRVRNNNLFKDLLFITRYSMRNLLLARYP